MEGRGVEGRGVENFTNCFLQIATRSYQALNP